MRNKILSGLVKAVLVASAAGVPMVASAAGFSLSEQSVTGLGRSFAGGAAFAEDASTLYYNPAGAVHLERAEVIQAASIISLGADFDKTSATDAIGQPLSGGEGGDVGKLGGVPVLYYSRPWGDDKAWGIAINAPFGLSTDYDRDSIFRYQAVYAQVSVVNIQPTVAKRWGNHSLGFGLDFQYMRVKLQNEIDFGSVCYGQVGPLTCQALGLNPQQNDGAVTLEGDSMGWGWNIGYLYKGESTSFGIAYRSQVDHELEGDADFNRQPAVFTAQNVFIDSDIQADFTTPELLSVSLVHALNDTWTLSFDATRTGWDTFQQLNVDYMNPNQPNTIENFNWVDVWKYAIGADYRYSDTWTFRAGVALDNSPVDDTNRSPRLPDGDRLWVSAGATWNMSDRWQLDAGYAYLQLNKGDRINLDHTGATADRIIGTYEADAHIVGIQVRHFFD